MVINSYERAILTALLKRRIWLNTTQIASIAQISWNTAKIYLERMYNRGWLYRKKNYWRVKK